MATAQFNEGIDVRTQLKLLFLIGFRGEFRDFYTLGNLSFGVPIQRSEQHDLLAGGGEDITLVNMEDRMLDRFADHQS